MWKLIDRLDRSFEAIDRAQHSIAAQDLAPGATGKAGSRGDGLADCPALLKAGLWGKAGR